MKTVSVILAVACVAALLPGGCESRKNAGEGRPSDKEAMPPTSRRAVPITVVAPIAEVKIPEASSAPAAPVPVPVAAPAPPTRKGYTLTFHDEFDGDRLDTAVWDTGKGKLEEHILSTRWPENCAVENGLLRLLTKKENRNGREWTTGTMWTKTFRQKYGYFEARMRITKAAAINNAFWLVTSRKGDKPGFEIDITEAHHPREYTCNLHNWGATHWTKGFRKIVAFDLSADFHIYALEWNEKELIWYLDGVEMRRLPNDICHDPAPILFSSAVTRWAGKITDAMDGTSQDVDWVRAWQCEKQPPAGK